MRDIHGLSGLADYFTRLEPRLIHHGEYLRPLVGTITTATIAAMDPNVPVRVRTYKGELANQCVVTFKNGRRIKYTYQPAHGRIAVHDYDTGQPLNIWEPNVNLTSVAQQIASWAAATVTRLPAPVAAAA